MIETDKRYTREAVMGAATARVIYDDDPASSTYLAYTPVSGETTEMTIDAKDLGGVVTLLADAQAAREHL